MATTYQDYYKAIQMRSNGPPRPFPSKEKQIADPYLAARAGDSGNIGRQVLAHLQYAAPGSRTYPEQRILAGAEISPAKISNVPRDRLAGIICVQASKLSHIAIFSRAQSIPAVMGLTALVMGNMDHPKLYMLQARGLDDKALKIDNEANTHRLFNHALNMVGLGALLREIDVPKRVIDLRCDRAPEAGACNAKGRFE